MPNTHLLSAALGHVQSAGRDLLEYMQNAPRDTDERIAALTELTDKADALVALEHLLGKMIIAERRRIGGASGR